MALFELAISLLITKTFETPVPECRLAKLIQVQKWQIWDQANTPHVVADLGGGAGAFADAFSSGIRTPADPKGPPLYYFEIPICGRLTLKFF